MRKECPLLRRDEEKKDKKLLGFKKFSKVTHSRRRHSKQLGMTQASKKKKKRSKMKRPHAWGSWQQVKPLNPTPKKPRQTLIL
jgi:hypothetical protein